MIDEKYMGHPSQCHGVEEHILSGGKGNGMRLLEVRNGLGLQFTVSADRCADISRLSFRGDNYGFFAPCGYVGPQFHHGDSHDGFVRSFTAGFLTTCGLAAVGAACRDDGEDLPIHGTVSNMPSDILRRTVDDDAIRIDAVVSDSVLFGRKLTLRRSISCSLRENVIRLTDTVKNKGNAVSPVMILYHFNMGYPLLDENALLHIPSAEVTPRNERAEKGLDFWKTMEKPQVGFEEQCYYHRFAKAGSASLYQHRLGKGIRISFDADELDCFVEWKMMGETDYVLGLEPGNCLPDGRDVMRERQILKFIEPEEEKKYSVTIEMIESESRWEKIRTE